MKWSNEVVLEFLDLYENEPVIWCVKHSEHKNRSAITDAWKRIEETISIECTIKELKNKKECLMSTFRVLMKKVQADSEQVFKPGWFAYEKMAGFLLGVCKPKYTQNTEKLEVSSDDEHDMFEDISQETDSLANEEAQAGPSNGDQEMKTPGNKKNLKRKSIGLLDEPYKILKTVINNEPQNTSQCSLYGQLIAQKLEALDEVERIIIMNDIDNLIFRATMKHLGRHTIFYE